MPAGYDLTEEQWEAHMKEIMELGDDEDTKSREIDMSWAVVFSRIDKNVFHYGPLSIQKANLHVSNLERYAHVPEGTSAGDTKIETILPTEDEDEIKRWRLIPCSAHLQFSDTWVRFRCKLYESQGHPENFEIEAKGKRVVDCKVYRMANDDNGNRLLWVNLKAKRNGVLMVIELCCKKIVGDEVTRLSRVEGEYVDQEEAGRFFEEPYTGF